jgi:L-alanine-DL-glutamate epimerase-like enolase superfamily enzyme
VVRAVVEDVLAGTLVGRDPRDIRARVEDMRVLLDGYLGWDGLSSQAIGAVEIALWDILGKSCGQPICRCSAPSRGRCDSMQRAPRCSTPRRSGTRASRP